MRDRSPLAEDVREVAEFYQLGPDCLWVTFDHDHLWWTFAHQDVTWLGLGDGSHGERVRKSLGGWRNTDVNGAPLRIPTLSTKLTKVTGAHSAPSKPKAISFAGLMESLSRSS